MTVLDPDFTLDSLQEHCIVPSTLSRKSVVSVPYSLLIVQPYTPQSWLDASTTASATWLSSPPLGIKKKRKTHIKFPAMVLQIQQQTTRCQWETKTQAQTARCWHSSHSPVYRLLMPPRDEKNIVSGYSFCVWPEIPPFCHMSRTSSQ